MTKDEIQAALETLQCATKILVTGQCENAEGEGLLRAELNTFAKNLTLWFSGDDSADMDQVDRFVRAYGV